MGMEPSWRNAVLLLVGSVLLLQGIIATDFVAKPGDIVVTDITNTSISLSWGRPAELNATQYNFSITYSSSNGNNSITEATNFTTITDLQSGTNYTIAVVTIVNETKSDPVVKAVFTKPNPVTNVTVFNHNTTSVTLNWVRPFDHKPEYSYRVETSGIPSLNSTVANESITVAQLNSGTRYMFSVFTLAADGTSADPVTVTFITVPSKPGTITVTAFSNSSISLSFGRPADMNVTQYNFSITYRPSNGVGSFTESINSTMIRDLESGTNYTISVTTIVHSGVKSEAVLINQFTKPNPVTEVRLVIRNTSIILSWEKPPDHKPEYSYNVEMKGSPSLNKIVSNESVVVRGLNPGTNYTFCVSTLAADKTPADCATRHFTTVPSKPGAITVTSFTNSSISLSLGKPTDMNVTQYNFSIMYSSSNGNSSFIEHTNSTTITDLEAGTNYVISVTTIVPGDMKSEAVVMNQFTKPNPVTNVTVFNHNTTSVTLNWVRPFDHKPEYSYRVETSGIPSLNSTVANESITVAQLNSGTRYMFSVFTLAADGTSADPVTVTFITVPSKPGTITVTGFSNSSISLSFGRPADMNVTQYNFSITYRPSNGVGSFTESINSTMIRDLESGTNYTISVTTIVHSGVKSEAVLINQFTKPNPVTEVRLVIRNTSIILSWEKPPDHKPEYSYNVEMKGSPSLNKIVSNESVVVRGLNPGTNYTFCVSTLAADKTPADCATRHFTTVPSKPGAITVTSFTNSSISLSLGKPTDMNVTQYNFSIMYSSSNGNSSFIEHTNSTTITDLEAGTNYVISVTTIVPGDMKSEAVVMNQFTKPNPVTNVTVFNHNTTSVTLNWVRPFDHKPEYSYRVETSGIPSLNSTVANESITVAQLNPGTRYMFSVFTLAADGTSADPVTVTFITVPSKPGTITVTGFSNSSISLSFGRPADMNVTQYNFSITYRPSNGVGSFTESINSTMIRDLESGTNYTISVTTIVHSGVKSEAVLINQFTKPNPVTEVRLVIRNTSIILSWEKPPDHKPEYSYNVEMKGSPSLNKIVSNESVVVRGLNPGTNYTFCVSTLAADKTPADCATRHFTTVPSKPGAITVTSFTNSSISLSLGKPTDMNVTQYNFSIMYSSSNGNSSFIEHTNSTTITDLEAGTNYVISVTTIVPGDMKSEAVVMNQFTKPNPVTNVTVFNHNTTSVTLNWVRPFDHKPEYSYRVETSGIPSLNSTVANESITVAQLNPGTRYMFSVFTLAADGTSADPVTVTFITVPSKPGTITVTGFSNSSISLSFGRPADMNVTQYNFSITYRPSNGVGSFTESINSTMIRDLESGTNYTISVTTIVHSGVKSEAVLINQFTKPNPVTEVRLVIRNTSIILSWEKPPDHKPEYSYNVEMKGSPSLNKIVSNESVVVRGLNPGTNYTFCVSTLAADKTPADCATRHFTTVPSKPGAITVTSFTNSSISLSLGKPTDMNVTQYNFSIMYSSSNGNSSFIEHTNSTTITDLEAGTNYVISVTTIVPGDMKSEAVVMNQFTKPNPVTNVTVFNHNTTSVTLNWVRPFDHKPEYSYRVETSGIPSLNSTVANESITVAQLNSGTRYMFSVFTLAADGTSADPVTVTFITVPSKPGTITVTAFSNSSISLSFGRPADMNVTQYNFSITYRPSNGVGSFTESINSTMIRDLESGTNYTISVTTIVHSGVKSEAVLINQFTKPNEVQNVKVVDASTNFVTLKWMRPMDYQDVYQYMVQTEGNPAPTSAYRNITVINENATISGLTPGTKYNFTITTLAADGTRANSVMVSSYTKPAQIPQENITVENNGTVDKLIVSWIPPPGNVEEFFVVVKDVKTSEVRADNTASTSPVTITGLRPGRVYNVTVITNSGYFNVTSDNVQGITVPSIPGSIHVTNFSTSSISLNWGAPADMDVGSYTFNVTYNDSSTTESMTAEINSTTISNLTSGTGYTISVATIGPGGLQSDFVSITQFTVPSIPGSINVTNFSTSSISLNWGAPADMDVGSYTFNVTYNDSSTTESMTAEMNSTTISNLASGTGYTISVATIGPGGLQSNFVSITQFTKPNPVSNIQVVNVNTRSITLNWTRPIEYGKEYTYMVLTKRSSAPTDVYGNVTVKIENITVEDLTPGIEYTFTVITLAADGTPAASVIISSYTKTVQVPHENITVENNGTVDKLIVSWIPPPGKVEEFFVIVKDVKTNEVRADNTASTLPVTFTGLRPGREYNITVITNSGPFNVTSDNVQGITVPSIPGSINVTNFSTSSISLNWGAPADMDVGSYTFNVTYSDSSTTESKTAEINSTTISNLTSGTGYTISVATIGPGGLQSDFVSITQFTVPNSIQNLEIVQTDTTSIILKWKKPFQYKDEYHYRVLTAESPAPTGSNGNQTVKNENATVLGLTPGTNYTFSVITLAQDGTAALPVTISTYTAPMKIPTENISLSNKHTTDSLTVSWIHPPGGVENFKIDIEDSLNPTSYKNSTTVPSSTNSVVFSSLRPGRKYNVNVTTISGSHDIPSDSVTRATIPSPPGIIVVTNITNSTIEIGWGRPEDMDIGGYNFSVTYQMAQAANTTFSTADNQSRIPDLNSGTQYNITVLTTGPESFISSFKTIYLYTQPNPVINLSVVSTNSTSIHLTWDEPLGYKSEYMYRVQTDGTPSSSTTVGTKFIIVSNLTSGDKFTFTVFTKVADGTEGNSVTLLQCTDAAAISSSSLKCQGVDLNPILHLEWTCPIGVNTGFRIQTTNSLVPLTESLECNPGQRQQFNLTNVTFFTSYTVNITTLSCGLQSTPTSIDCMSGITQPSLPPVKLTLPGLEITHKTIKFSIGEDTFNSSSGPIVAIAVIVTKEQSNNIPDGKTIETAFSPAVSAYTTQVIQLQTGTQSTRAAALTDPIPVIIGNDSESFGYINKELTPLTGYQISLAGFTKIEFDNAHKKIVANKSFFSAYYYSERITSHQNPDVIIGAVVGCVLGAIVISLLVLLLIWWKKRTKSDNKSVTQLPIPNIRVARNAINVDYFEGYFSKQHADSDCGFAEEYEELKTVGTLQSTQVSQQLLNKPKNRYSNVLPYDTSRVKLSVTEDPSSDYINANFMPGYNSKKEFIAAQGPLLNTVSDFWRMIWEHYVPAIVMLTKCVEQGRAKCEQYWPTERPLIFEDKIISLTSEVILPDWTIRDFTIVKDKSGEKHALRQFHFTGWPDHGVPNTTEVLIEFRNLVRQYINQHPMSGPTVVHCSAGVGRTGTFISIDHMIYQIDNNRKVDIWGTVYQLRMNRPLMVQTESQYVFLNQCAMEYIRSSKQQTSDTIYQNAPALIYENTSALRAAQMANGHAL